MSTSKYHDDHFKRFTVWLEREIAKYGVTDGDYYDRQKAQFDKLVALETEFRKTLIEHSKGAATYRAFINLICEEKRNILSARPYFRERQSMFTKYIAKALKKRNEKSLYRFRFNYQFVLFVVNSRKWGARSPITRLAEEIKQIRTEIVEMNMPLAISRARIFWSRTPKSHLTLMDLIQISSEGLMSGIDKFVPPFNRVFRSVAIGRMTGNFIEHYCIDPATKVLTDDLRWVRADSLAVGDGIVGFDEEPGSTKRRRWANSVVTSTGLVDLPKRRIVTEHATVDVSDGHMFLCFSRNGYGYQWIRADRIQIGDQIRRIGDWGDAIDGLCLDDPSLDNGTGVISNKSIGTGPVVTIGTSTKTLITEGLLSHNSETPIHFYPTDKRKIYRANKVVHKHQGVVDYEKLAGEVNVGVVEAAQHTNPAEIAGLMAAASVVSADSTLSQDPEAPEPISRFAAPDSGRPDRQVEERNAMLSMAAAIERLTVFEKKLLRLRGVAV
jgi:hypothetical protein